MSDAVEIWEQPEAREIYMIAGWRQWADAGSISSSLPRYIIQQTGARPIGAIKPDGFYLFQIPGTHHLMRPVITFEEGFPQSLESPRNEIFYSGDQQRGLVIFLGDEPHLAVERYVASFLKTAEMLGVKRIVGLGGVYGELPYDKARTVSGTYSQPHMKDELIALSVDLSNYEGGAAIGSIICKRASEQNIEFTSLYAFVPTYDFSEIAEIANGIRLETDFMAWLGVMRRIKHMLKLDFDLSDLEKKSRHLIDVMNTKLEELADAVPEASLQDYMARLSEAFTETPFDPLSDVWEEELRKLFDDSEGDES